MFSSLIICISNTAVQKNNLNIAISAIFMTFTTTNFDLFILFFSLFKLKGRVDYG